MAESLRSRDFSMAPTVAELNAPASRQRKLAGASLVASGVNSFEAPASSRWWLALAKHFVDCLSENFRRILQAHAFFRPQFDFRVAEDAARADDRRHREADVADLVRPGLQCRDRQDSSL